MQKVYANNLVPKGSYICLECGAEQNLDEKDVLLPCLECGSDLFKATIVMTLSPDEIYEKFKESIRVLAVSTFLYESCEMSEFLNVISINLRMLLCDGENSLLPRVVENPVFHPISGKYENNVIFPKELFSRSKSEIPLYDFLEQVIIKRPGSRPVTIKKMIRAVASKCGGAHLDIEIHEDYYLSSSVSKHYFIEVAKYVIDMAGIDYETEINQFLLKLETGKNKILK